MTRSTDMNESQAAKNIRLRLRLVMKKEGLSINSFATELNEKPQRIKDILTERQRLPASVLYKVAAHFNVDANWLLFGTGTPREEGASKRNSAMDEAIETHDLTDLCALFAALTIGTQGQPSLLEITNELLQCCDTPEGLTTATHLHQLRNEIDDLFERMIDITWTDVDQAMVTRQHATGDAMVSKQSASAAASSTSPVRADAG